MYTRSIIAICVTIAGIISYELGVSPNAFIVTTVLLFCPIAIVATLLLKEVKPPTLEPADKYKLG
jgi:hypothetical protein